MRANSQSRFRPRRYPPIPETHPEDVAFYEKAKAEATNRMLVFDVAPFEVRQDVNYYPSNDEGVASQSLRRWWGGQNEWDFNEFGELVPARNTGWF